MRHTSQTLSTTRLRPAEPRASRDSLMQPGSPVEGQRASSFSKSTELGANLLCQLQDTKFVRTFQALSFVQAFNIRAFKAACTSSSIFPRPKSFVLGAHLIRFHNNAHLLHFESPIEVLAICQLSQRSQACAPG